MKISLFISSIMIFFVSYASAAEQGDSLADLNYTSMSKSNSWMSKIDDDKRISELSIPGTHDTVTYNYGVIHGDVVPGVKTQSLNINEQLYAGTRFLDIRAKVSGGGLEMYHGDFDLHLGFQKILDECKDFLKKNPTETILMSLKNEGDTSDKFEANFLSYVNQDKSVWYLGTIIPRLRDVRGKIVLMPRFNTSYGIRLSFDDNKTFEKRLNETAVGVTVYGAGSYFGVGDNSVGTWAKALGMMPGGKGYWIMTAVGKVKALGDAKYYGQVYPLNGRYRLATDIAVTPSGNGYWILTTEGAVHPFGDAKFYGNPDNFDETVKAALALKVTKTGMGYWILDSDGVIYAYGDALNYGSGCKATGHPVDLGITATNKGYWILNSEGGVCSYGDARNYGEEILPVKSNAAQSLGVTTSGNGYWIVSSHGKIFPHGDAVKYNESTFYMPQGMVCDFAVNPAGGGYTILSGTATESLYVEDNYSKDLSGNTLDRGTKWDAVKAHLLKAQDGIDGHGANLFITFTSANNGTSLPLRLPSYYSDEINPKLNDFFNPEYRAYGIIAMDFTYATLNNVIIKTNYPKPDFESMDNEGLALDGPLFKTKRE